MRCRGVVTKMRCACHVAGIDGRVLLGARSWARMLGRAVARQQSLLDSIASEGMLSRSIWTPPVLALKFGLSRSHRCSVRSKSNGGASTLLSKLRSHDLVSVSKQLEAKFMRSGKQRSCCRNRTTSHPFDAIKTAEFQRAMLKLELRLHVFHEVEKHVL